METLAGGDSPTQVWGGSQKGAPPQRGGLSPLFKREAPTIFLGWEETRTQL